MRIILPDRPRLSRPVGGGCQGHAATRSTSRALTATTNRTKGQYQEGRPERTTTGFKAGSAHHGRRHRHHYPLVTGVCTPTRYVSRMPQTGLPTDTVNLPRGRWLSHGTCLLSELTPRIGVKTETHHVHAPDRATKASRRTAKLPGARSMP